MSGADVVAQRLTLGAEMFSLGSLCRACLECMNGDACLANLNAVETFLGIIVPVLIWECLYRLQLIGKLKESVSWRGIHMKDFHVDRLIGTME